LRRWVFLLILLLIPGFFLIWHLRSKADQGVYGTDMIYVLDEEGNARVTMVDKVYFTTPAVEKNFEETLSRPVAVQDLELRIKEMVQKLAREAGVSDWAVDGFSGYRKKEVGFGGRYVSFTWKNFARRQGNQLVVDFRFAQKIRMNEHSSLVIVPPAGLKIIRLEPVADSKGQDRLVWQGPKEIAWPYLVLARP